MTRRELRAATLAVSNAVFYASALIASAASGNHWYLISAFVFAVLWFLSYRRLSDD